MKLIFLDIDGVLNCRLTSQRHRGFIGIDPYMVAIFNRVIEATGAQIVLSSTWRLSEDGREEVRAQVLPFIDCTPQCESRFRGDEIQQWLAEHPLVKCATPTSCPPHSRAMCQGHPVEKYAILDDDGDFHPDQPLFQTTWEQGLTQEIADAVVAYLKA